MNLFINRDDEVHREIEQDDSSPHYLWHETEPADFYSKYENDNAMPKKDSYNPLNLFDDSDEEDHYWVYIAKRHISLKKGV